MADVEINKDPGDSARIARQSLEEGIAAAESGHRELALASLRQAVTADPRLGQAWLWLGGLAQDPQEALGYLEQAKALLPDDPAIDEGIRWCKSRIPPTATQVEALASLTSPAVAPASPPDIVLSAPSPVTEALPPPRPAEVSPPSAPAEVAGHVSRGRGALRPILSILGILIASLILWAVGARAFRAVSGGPAPTATPTPTQQEIIDGLIPQLNDAWRSGRWTVAISILERIRGMDPSYGGVDEWLATAYTAMGREMAMEGRWEQAFVALDAALVAKPDHAGAKAQRQAATQFLSGQQKYDAGDWEGAASDLQSVFRLDRAYRDVEKRLYLAYWRLGSARQAAGDLVGAKGALEAALGVRPDSQEAADKLAEVNLILFPPTPTPTPRPPKRIVVDISEQHFYAYEGSKLVYSWVCSTGEPGRDTATGEFSVQSKIPEAYSYIWRLRMPYWLGIYWAGSTENGIHALPINPNGQTLWAGFLGRKVSFGCVILDTAAAKQLFDWAEIGTPVSIRY